MEPIGFALILIGIFTIIVGFLILMFSKASKVEGGGIFLIGPFPIIFGTNEKIVYALILITISIMLLYLLFILFLWR